MRHAVARRHDLPRPYLQRLAAAHGFAVERAQHSLIRKERDQGVDSLLVVRGRAGA